MTIFFLNAPAHATRRVLPLMKEGKYNDITVVVPQDLALFFESHTDAKVIVSRIHQNLITQKTKHKLISNAIRSILEYRKLFGNIRGEDVCLFCSSWAVLYFSYVAKLSKHNTIHFYPEDDAHVYDEKKGLMSLAMKWFAKIFLGVDIYIIDKEGKPVWELKRDSFPMETVHYDKFDDGLLDVKFDISDNLRVLFLSDDIGTEGALNSEIIELTDTLKNILDRKFLGEYAVKAHPRDKKIYGRMKHAKNILPSYMLAEMLYKHKWDYIIGYYSEALQSAKLFTDAKVISLIHLWHWDNKKLKEHLLEFLEDRKVLLPKTIDELEKMLNENRVR